jgi:hypothetical protein
MSDIGELLEANRNIIDPDEEEFLRYVKQITKKVDYIEGRFEKIYINEPFDFKKHKDNFINYLEVIITPDGEIKYAVPDHRTALINYCNLDEKDKSITREVFLLDSLIERSKCICVYTYEYRGKANDKQINVLSHLKDYGLYKGDLKNVC